MSGNSGMGISLQLETGFGNVVAGASRASLRRTAGGGCPQMPRRGLLGLADSVILDYIFGFPDQFLVGAFRLQSFAPQFHSIARLDALCVAGERIDLVVFLVGEGHAVGPRAHTARNRSLFRIVNRDDNDDYHYGDSCHNCADYFPGCDTADWTIDNAD